MAALVLPKRPEWPACRCVRQDRTFWTCEAIERALGGRCYVIDVPGRVGYRMAYLVQADGEPINSFAFGLSKQLIQGPVLVIWPTDEPRQGGKETIL